MSELAAEPRMLIDGKLVEAASGATYGNINPATEEVAGQVADAGPDDMDRAIEAARRAFDETDWSTNPAFRKRCLQQLKEALDKEKETLRPQIVDRGRRADHAHVRRAAGLLHRRHAVGHRPHRSLRVGARPARSTSSWGCRATGKVVHEPVGVVGAITPWNFPFMLNLSKIAPALAAGNTVVLKPAPDTPWSATFIGKRRGRADRHPAGRAQHRDVGRPGDRRGDAHDATRASTWSASPARPRPAGASWRTAPRR